MSLLKNILLLTCFIREISNRVNELTFDETIEFIGISFASTKGARFFSFVDKHLL
jgi:hypothetical protein